MSGREPFPATGVHLDRPMTDEELYAMVRIGNVRAFDQLYARYERRLFGFVLRLLNDRALAEEVFHDVLLSMLHGEEASFQEARFRAWLFRVARNACANRMRSKSRGEGALSRVTLNEEAAASPEQRLVEEERAFALASAVRKLPEALKDVFHLRTSGLSYGEIADVLEVPLGTVKSRMNALVQQLQGEVS
jgi:RNA polymerase sigma-70 factor (ECF subfamily)